AIMLGSSRVFDRRFVRALVEAIGLFPVGSYVQLSSGAEAQVVGAHANRIDRPLVRFLTPGVQRAPASLVLDLDMLDPWELHVIRAIDPPRSVGLGPLTRAAS